MTHEEACTQLARLADQFKRDEITAARWCIEVDRVITAVEERGQGLQTPDGQPPGEAYLRGLTHASDPLLSRPGARDVWLRASRRNTAGGSPLPKDDHTQAAASALGA